MSRIAPPPADYKDEDSDDSGSEDSGNSSKASRAYVQPSAVDDSGVGNAFLAPQTASKKLSDNFIPSDLYTGPKIGFTFKARGHTRTHTHTQHT